jgi:hypothetical protein
VKGEEVTLDEVRDALNRSGYMQESRIVRALTMFDFFVEPNRSIRDPRTGKSREIDLVAEYYGNNPPGVCVKTHFVMEAINNSYPFVLTTPRPSTPNADFENYIKIITTPGDSCPFRDTVDVYEVKDASFENLYSQYCSLSRKADKAGTLMASHTDDVYSSLMKMAEYVEDSMSVWTSSELYNSDRYWRMFFWRPVLVLGGKLLCVQNSSKAEYELIEAERAKLEFNWHVDNQPMTTVIDVVTEGALIPFLLGIVKEDESIQQKIHAAKHARDDA